LVSLASGHGIADNSQFYVDAVDLEVDQGRMYSQVVVFNGALRRDSTEIFRSFQAAGGSGGSAVVAGGAAQLAGVTLDGSTVTY